MRHSDIMEVRIPFPIPSHRLDPDAIGIIRRLTQHGHLAYLVGGCIRDLHEGLPPKDFDIATSARPNQVKRIFRNSRIIGRRFRLAHIHVGHRIIEVSTFRGMVQDTGSGDDSYRPLRHDNVFGSPEEDAMRRDFTINGLFYDIATSEIIDYVGGFTDLRRRVIRCIGDPEARLQEDPVRMIRAVKLAGRVNFTLDPPLEEAIHKHLALVRQSSSARVMEELFKMLASGAASNTIRVLAVHGFWQWLLPEISDRIPNEASEESGSLYRYLDALDAADQGLRSHSNAVLLAALLLPVLDPDGVLLGKGMGEPGQADPERDDDEAPRHGLRAVQDVSGRIARFLRGSAILRNLPRRDLHRLGQILAALRRLVHPHVGAPPIRLIAREFFPDALALLRITVAARDLDEAVVQHWEGAAGRYAVPKREARGWQDDWDDIGDVVDMDPEFDEVDTPEFEMDSGRRYSRRRSSRRRFRS